MIKMLDSTTLYSKAAVNKFKAVNINTGWFPGFPTDLQALITVPLAIAHGTSTIKETIYEDRFAHVNELVRMGADIKVNNHVAVINGVQKLSGTKIVAPDIRGGAGLVVAGLVASGKTEVTGLKHIDRGYENLEQKLSSLGANIIRTKNISGESSSEENIKEEKKTETGLSRLYK